jgi:hypothetical protein
MPVNVITESRHQPGAGKLHNLFCGVHQVQKKRSVGILPGDFHPFPHTLYWNQHCLTSIFWERSNYTPQHKIATEK